MGEMDIEQIVRRVAKEIGAKLASGSASVTREAMVREAVINGRDDVKRVAMGSDHAGLNAKKIVTTYLETLGYRVTDVGTHTKEPVDYPDFAVAVAKKVASGECERGIMIDGAGVCSSIVCNKVHGIRAAFCYDLRTVITSREHANANVLTLGGRFQSGAELCEMAKLWLETRFAGKRHWSRTNKMMATERGRSRDGSERAG